MILLTSLFLLIPELSAADFNAAVLEAVNELKNKGGNYSISAKAAQELRNAITVVNGELAVDTNGVNNTFCSSATYLVFLKALLSINGKISGESAQALRALGQLDGTGIWGRWNANGPGTARLFYELKLGPNFTKWARAKPGDFMKIFWTDEIGKNERGHSVVYLGATKRENKTFIRFWSSNTGSGMSVRTVDIDTIRRVVFSRLEFPEKISGAHTIPKTDSYLRSLLSQSSSPIEKYQKIGIPVGGTK